MSIVYDFTVATSMFFTEEASLATRDYSFNIVGPLELTADNRLLAPLEDLSDYLDDEDLADELGPGDGFRDG